MNVIITVYLYNRML